MMDQHLHKSAYEWEEFLQDLTSATRSSLIPEILADMARLEEQLAVVEDRLNDVLRYREHGPL